MGAIEGLLLARSLMLQHVYAHHTTRAYEGELQQTLRLAFALTDRLPDDTPEPVRVLIQKRGDLNTKEYLMLDDEVMWWALRRWAAWHAFPSDDTATLARALSRHSLRLVRRQTPWTRRNLEQNKMRHALDLVASLKKEGNPLQYECLVDHLENLPYKDYRHPVRNKSQGNKNPEGERGEQAYFVEICLFNGKEAEPLSEIQNSPFLRAMGEELQLCRFYYDRSFADDFAGLFKEFGVCSDREAGG